MRTLLALTALLTACGTGPDFYAEYDAGGTDSDSDADTDGDTDTTTDTSTDVDSDSDTETETVTDTGTETDTGTDTGVDPCPAGVAYLDEATGLCWQQDPSDTASLSWSDAVDYCEELDLGGHTDWRLPSVGELRSIVRGCTGNATGESCAVSDSCLTASCWSDATCPACTALAGPDDGCYWIEGLDGSCSLSWYWTSSTQADNTYYAWDIAFNAGGRTGLVAKNVLLAARCARTAE